MQNNKKNSFSQENLQKSQKVHSSVTNNDNSIVRDSRTNDEIIHNSSVNDNSLKNRLLEGLEKIPSDWVLTPVKGNKAPYRKGWQNEKPLSRDELKAEIEHNPECQGYGIRCGHNGLLIIDPDGESARNLYIEMFGEIPHTVKWTSGKPGRENFIVKVPEQYRDKIKSKALKTGIKGEQLEFRWIGGQSVLPPSVHPETGQYRWINSPDSIDIAPCPQGIIDYLIETEAKTYKKKQSVLREKPEGFTPKSIDTSALKTDIDKALSYLEAIPNNDHDYETWLNVGMALHSVDDSLLDAWINWSEQSSKHIPGECERKWNSFNKSGITIATLGKLAKNHGWQSKKALEKKLSYLINVNSKEIEFKGSKEQFELWQKLNDFKYNLVVNLRQFKYTEELLKEYCAYLIKSAMGTGKTEASIILAKELANLGYRIIWVTKTTLLAKDTVNRARDNTKYFLTLVDDNFDSNLFADKDTHLCLCAESIGKFAPYIYKDKYILFIDEFDGVAQQITSGGTVSGENQTNCLESFSSAVESASMVYALSATLSNKEVNLINAYKGNKELVCVNNEHPPQKQKIIICEPVKFVEDGKDKKKLSRDSSWSIAEISKKEVIPFITTDSLKNANAIEEYLLSVGKIGFNFNALSKLETWAELLKQCPQWKERLEANNPEKLSNLINNFRHYHSPWSEDFLDNPNQFIKDYCPDFFMGTPAMGTGVSVTIQNYFTHKFVILSGVLSVSGIAQMCVRLRTPIPTFVSIPNNSNIIGGVKVTNDNEFKDNTPFSEAYLLDSIREKTKEIALDSVSDLPNLENAMIASLQRSNHLKDWADYSFRHQISNDFEKINYKSCFEYLMLEIGYDVSRQDVNIDGELTKAIKEIKKQQVETKGKERFEIDQVKPLTDEEATALQDKELNKEQSMRMWMYRLRDNLPGINNSDAWNEENIIWVTQKEDNQENLIHELSNYELIKNPELLKSKNFADKESKVNRNNAKIFYPQLTKDHYRDVQIDKDCGLDAIIEHLEKGEYITKEHELIDGYIAKIKVHSRARKLKHFAIKSSIDKRNHLDFIKKRLAKYGIFTKENGKQVRRGQKLTKWILDNEDFNHPFRKAALESIKVKNLQWMENYQQRQQLDKEASQKIEELKSNSEPQSDLEVCIHYLEACPDEEDFRTIFTPIYSLEFLEEAANHYLMPIGQSHKINQWIYNYANRDKQLIDDF